MTNMPPNLTSKLRTDIVQAPSAIKAASGITLFGKKIRSIIYTMDVAVIANCDADAILAVYPWTPNTRILQAVATVANVPILANQGLASRNHWRFCRRKRCPGRCVKCANSD